MVSLALALLLTGVAAADTQAVLQVTATVAPSCSFAVEPARSTTAPSAVRASCGASRLRTLRVSAGDGAPPVRVTGRQVRAGGDIVFLVSRAETAGDRRGMLVTLDF
jgi:hypothetical protein